MKKGRVTAPFSVFISIHVRSNLDCYNQRMNTLTRLLSFHRLLIVIIVVTAVSRIAFSAPLYLLDDEAYYWVWSRNLSWSYYDHPPMVAWLVYLATSVLGDEPWVIRLPAIVSIAVASYVGVRLIQKIYGHGAAYHYLAFTVVALIFFGTAAGMVPDAPMTMFMALSLYYFYRAVFEGSWKSWYGVGLFLGLAFLSKYIAVLWAIAMLMFMLINPKARAQLRTPHPWLASALALIVFSPVFIWNAQHDWASFLFQLGHGLPQDKQGDVVGYLVGQAAIITPGVFIILIGTWFGVLRQWKQMDSKIQWLVLCSLFPFLFFLYASTKAPVSANWPAFSYFTGLMLVAAWHSVAKVKWKQAVVGINYVLLLVLPALLVAQIYWKVLPLGEADPTKRYFGWPSVFKQVELLKELYPDAIVVGNRYQTASQIAYYFKVPHIPALNIEARANHYDYISDEPLRGKDVLIIDKGYHPERFEKCFESVEVVAEFKGLRPYRSPLQMRAIYGKNYQPEVC
ncbi:MAG: hypothetical protein BMS9Abin36_0815 [Gammaproteobacteria bacterium]|nr:MAG: hypothetical protein BMS9Abin36_0815 [Gammaproteobacteria bacterium]